MKRFTPVARERFAGGALRSTNGPPANKRVSVEFRFGGVLADVRSGNTSSLPSSWRWDGVAGQSYVTRVFQQNEPQYCGSCWAHATLTSLADRIKIASAAQGEFPDADVTLSVQAVLNCGKRTAGTCESGTIHGVFDYIDQANGVPYETCMNYDATDAETVRSLVDQSDAVVHAIGLLFDVNSGLTALNNVVSGSRSQAGAESTYDNITRKRMFKYAAR